MKNSKIRTLIVDDEKESRDGLKILLEKESDIEVINTCANGLEAIKAIETELPDLVFLDIQMPKINGFEVINSIDVKEYPEFMFITAYDRFALKAFEIHALDYLLKPFTDERFREALNHARKVIYNKNVEVSSEKIRQLTDLFIKEIKEKRPLDQFIGQLPSYPNKLIIKSSGKIHFVNLSDIIWIEAFDYYVRVHTTETTLLMKETMKSLEEQLQNKQFIRISRFAIVNIDFINNVSKYFKGNYLLTLLNGKQLKVGKSYIHNLPI